LPNFSVAINLDQSEQALIVIRQGM